MGWTEDALAGLAQLIENGGVGTWQATGKYPAGSANPIFIKAAPAMPDSIITLTPYVVSDDGTLNDSVLGVQIRFRGTTDPRAVEDVADAVFDRLHGAGSVALSPTAWLVHAARMSGTPLGPDGNGRHERTDNYYLTVNRPSLYRTE